MENGKTKSEKFPAVDFSSSVEKVCAACGAQIEPGAAAKFCRVCGKFLTEDYQPLDRFRASYHLQGKNFGFENAPERADT